MTTNTKSGKPATQDSALHNLQDDATAIRGPLTDLQRQEAGHLLSNFRHLGREGDDHVMRAIAVMGYTNGVRDMKEPAPAPQAVAAGAEEVQWNDIQKVVKELADFCFGDGSQMGQISLGAAYASLVSSLTAKDGLSVRLDPLPQPIAERAQQEIVRFCPHCGLVGEVGEQYRDCCPDGNGAYMVPRKFADQCHNTFKLCLSSAAQPAAVAPAVAHEAVREPELQQSGAVYGIIDPDYGRLYSIIRTIAWQEGYAIGLHGSFTRDLDLIAVPWADRVCEPAHLIRRILSRTDLKEQHSNPGIKPHGRTAWTLLLPEFGDPRFVDLSIMPMLAAAPSPDAPAGKEDK